MIFSSRYLLFHHGSVSFDEIEMDHLAKTFKKSFIYLRFHSEYFINFADDNR